jgi:hypothetical protein
MPELLQYQEHVGTGNLPERTMPRFQFDLIDKEAGCGQKGLSLPNPITVRMEIQKQVYFFEPLTSGMSIFLEAGRREQADDNWIYLRHSEGRHCRFPKMDALAARI